MGLYWLKSRHVSIWFANELILSWVSQNVIPPGYNTGGMQMFAFTEQGIAMLSTVLKSKNATTVSIAIMRAFVAMRRFLTANANLFQRVDARYNKQTELDFDKHNSPCAEIKKVQLPNHIHDRYLIVDDDVWLLGASAKDMGHGLCTVIKVGFTTEMVLGMLK